MKAVCARTATVEIAMTWALDYSINSSGTVTAHREKGRRPWPESVQVREERREGQVPALFVYVCVSCLSLSAVCASESLFSLSLCLSCFLGPK